MRAVAGVWRNWRGGSLMMFPSGEIKSALCKELQTPPQTPAKNCQKKTGIN